MPIKALSVVSLQIASIYLFIIIIIAYFLK